MAAWAFPNSIILSGELTALLLVTVLVFQGLREYGELVGLPETYRRVLLGPGLLPAPVALLSIEAFHARPTVLLIAATLQPLTLSRQAGGIRHLAFAALGW